MAVSVMKKPMAAHHVVIVVKLRAIDHGHATPHGNRSLFESRGSSTSGLHPINNTTRE